MSRLAKLQLIGPIIIFTAALAAELAAYALAQHPTSGWLWYINLRLFEPFQQSYYALDGRIGIPACDIFLITLPLLVLGCVGVAWRRRLLLALSSNLSFVYAAFLFYAWGRAHPPTTGPSVQASLTVIAGSQGPNFYLMATLIGVSLLSCCISHVIYVRSARARGAMVPA